MSKLPQSGRGLPVQNPVLGALYGFMASELLLALDRLKVFEQISRHKSVTAATLATGLGLNREALERALQAAACWGLVKIDRQLFSLDDTVSPLLDPSSNDYCGAFFNHFRNNTIPVFSHLDEALRGGKAQWSALTAGDRGDEHAFTHIFSSEEHARDFHAAMWRLSYGPSQELVSQGLVGDSRTLVDLGGGVGSFAIAAAKANPRLTVTVVDLPAVAPHCEQNIRKEELQERVSFRAGDFWQDALPFADTYSLGYILSDWNDEESTRLLRRVKSSLCEGGRVLVLERLLDEDRSGPFVGVMQDLAMMLETGGQHRPASRYRALLEEAGFRDITVIRTSGDKHAVVGVAF
ncbi:methyltransferase [Allohahella sp. A8]|uniref:methyltransferase n=1 Tax=Allohahella sp. A8 TaxID=3141461 RepID=UPI003A80BCAA